MKDDLQLMLAFQSRQGVEMKSVILKTAAVTLISILGSLALVLTIVPALGGTVGAIGWLMCFVCPLFIATPLGFFTFLQGEKLKSRP
jgi:hypothetical protein